MPEAYDCIAKDKLDKLEWFFFSEAVRKKVEAYLSSTTAGIEATTKDVLVHWGNIADLRFLGPTSDKELQTKMVEKDVAAKILGTKAVGGKDDDIDQKKLAATAKRRHVD